MEDNGPLGDRQTEPDAARVTAAIAFDPEKWLKNRHQHVFRHTGPLVTHRDHRLPVARLNAAFASRWDNSGIKPAEKLGRNC